jgi:hypothetical protein
LAKTASSPQSSINPSRCPPANDYRIDPECDCPEIWDFPFQPRNTWVLVDAEGVVVGAFYQWYPTIDAIEILIEGLTD